MKRFFAILVIFLGFAFSSKAQPEDTLLFVKNLGNVYLTGDYKLFYDTAGNIIAFKTDKVLNIGFFSIAPNTFVYLYPSGQIRSFIPFYPFTVNINGTVIYVKPLNPVYFYKNGKIKEVKLAKEIVIETKYGSELTALPGSNLYFYDNGSLKAVLPKYPVVLNLTDGTTLTLKPLRPVVFYPNGKIKSGFVNLVYTTEKYVFEKGDFIKFDSLGNIVK